MDLYKKHGVTFVDMSLAEFKLYLAKFQNLTTGENLRYLRSEDPNDKLQTPNVDEFVNGLRELKKFMETEKNEHFQGKNIDIDDLFNSNTRK